MIVSYKVNKFPLETAVNAAKSVIAVYKAIKDEYSALPAIDAVKDGTRAVEERLKVKKNMADRLEAAKAKALSAINVAESEMQKVLESITVPNGSDFTSTNGNPDFLALNLKLIQTPEELEKILERQNNSPAFIRLVENYAKEKGWHEYEKIPTTAPAIVEAADSIIDICRIAAQNPDGYQAMNISDNDIITNVSTASGVADCYVSM